MNELHGLTPHDASPEIALAALRDFDGPVLADLDETLYLRNSTEDFLDSAEPGVLALLTLRALDQVKPWRWTGGPVTRDVWRVRTVMLLFPWVRRRWRQRVGELAERFGNTRLIGTLAARSATPIVVTAGFLPIVAPLLEALGLGDAALVATGASDFSDRRKGKLRLAVECLGQTTVRQSFVITDSPDDLPLLDACARPARTVWPEARCQPAHSGVYLPGQYLSLVKRPGERYIVRGILQEDFALWLLCSLGLAAVPLVHVAGLLFLLLSFWAIYERGYVDNDECGARYEKDPKLSEAFRRHPVSTPALLPWVWATAAGSIAIALLSWPRAPLLEDFLKWAGVLLATHGWFHLYNRFDKATRVWFYPGLQLARTAAFAALVPVGIAASLALAAHVIARWVPYYFYRFGPRDWPQAPMCLTRLLFFIVMLTLIALTEGFGPVLQWTTVALLAWNLWRARSDLRESAKVARRIDGAGAA